MREQQYLKSLRNIHVYDDVYRRCQVEKIKAHRSEILCINMIELYPNTAIKKCQDKQTFKEKLFLFQVLWGRIVIVSLM